MLTSWHANEQSKRMKNCKLEHMLLYALVTRALQYQKPYSTARVSYNDPALSLRQALKYYKVPLQEGQDLLSQIPYGWLELEESFQNSISYQEVLSARYEALRSVMALST